MTAVLAWSAAAHPRTECIIAPDNAPSLRVAARLGYREIGRADLKGSPILVFERLAA
jgi:RimJ/RimL family protein N-acetyltransferase